MTASRLSLLLVLCLTPAAASSQALDIDLSQQAVVRTTQGTFVLSFYPAAAPQHVRRFLALAASGAYDGASFHHVIRWGIVQAGPTKKSASPLSGFGEVRAELSGIQHARGTLSAIPSPGQPEISSDHFFICVTPQAALDGKYCVFGFVAEGIEVIDRISETAVDAGGTPLDPVVLESVTLRPARPAPPPAFSQETPAELSRYRALLETSLGNITLEFYPDLAPNHVRNFLRLAQAGFYDGTAFHRVVHGFVAQGGMLSTRQPPLPPFRISDLVRKLEPEFNRTRHTMGILSMARYDDPASAETSFFICLGNAENLDNLYTVFGKVAEGVEILDRFQEVETDGEAPRQRIELRKVTLIRK